MGNPMGANRFGLLRTIHAALAAESRRPWALCARGRLALAGALAISCAASARAADAPTAPDKQSPHLVMMIGEDEYDTKRTLPQFAGEELRPLGWRVTVCQATEDEGAPNNFPGLEALDDADVLLLSVRRRTPRAEQLARVQRFLESGHPLVGIRTASHAFDREPEAGCARWEHFDREILGVHYQGHYGNKPPDSPRTLIFTLASAAEHPIVRGLEPLEFDVSSHLYKNRDIAPSVRVLMEGQVAGLEQREPVTWVIDEQGKRVFYTSLGNPDDFEMPVFRKLLVRGLYWAIGQSVPEE